MTPADFAAAVIALLTDEDLRMARATAALELARTRFSPIACYAELLAFVSTAPLHAPERPMSLPARRQVTNADASHPGCTRGCAASSDAVRSG